MCLVLKINELLKKIDAWNVIALLILFYTYMVSGYMITRGFIDRYWGILLHNRLDLLLMVMFSIHIAIRLRFILIRRKLADGFILNTITLLVGVLPMSFITYLDLFFRLA